MLGRLGSLERVDYPPPPRVVSLVDPHDGRNRVAILPRARQPEPWDAPVAHPRFVAPVAFPMPFLPLSIEEN